MDLQKLEYFLAVRDSGSINAAASQLGVAQPTISQALRTLEREFGVELFHRIGRGMVPTSAGHALAGPARRLIRAISSASGSVHREGDDLHGSLALAIAPPLAGGTVVETIAAFHRRHPRVQLRLNRIRAEAHGLEMVRDGDVEILVVHLPIEAVVGGRLEERRLDVVPLGHQEYWYAAPPHTQGLPPPGSPIALGQLPDNPLVVVPEGATVAGVIERELAGVGRLAPPAAVLEHREARMAFVAAGIGATFLERSMLEAAAARGIECRKTVPPIRREFGLVYSADEASTAAKAFIDVAGELVAAEAAAGSR